MKITRGDLALVALRLVLGAAFVAHGWPKIQHPTSWAAYVLPGTPPFLQAISAIVEFVGGIAMLIGFGTRVAGFFLAADMVVAIFFVLVPHGAPFVSNVAGTTTFELPLTYLTLAFALVLLGSGRFSIDVLREGRDGGRGKMGSRTGGRRR